MAISRVDQGELLTALHSAEGLPPFSVFLTRLCRRVGGREALLIERRKSGGWITRRAALDPASPPGSMDSEALLRVRPGRVYSIAEIAPDDPWAGRLIRSTELLGEQWLVVRSDRDAFDAADGALLAGLSPHVAIACDNRSRFAALRRDRAAAETALARAGIGWTALDAEGDRLAGTAPPGTRTERAALVRTLSDDRPQAVDARMVALRAPRAGDAQASIALFRVPPQTVDRAAAFQAEHGCTRGEASLAVALAEGATIVEAAALLGLTAETARNYSKRLYARTGARNQADLVRRVWTGLAALA